MRDVTTNRFTTTRRGALGAAAGAAGLAALGRPAWAQQLAMPSAPVAISIMDVAGNLALTRAAIEGYRDANRRVVSGVTFTQAPSPELAGKLRAQQEAGRVDIDLVLTGGDGLAAGIEQNLWTPVLPAHAASLPNIPAVYTPAAQKMQTLARGQGVVVTSNPAGPVLTYMADEVRTPPKSTAELLAWARQNPNKFMYPRPANSGPGRAFLMGLPYILGDSNPADPQNGWDKTWAYLKELNQYIEYYTAGTAAAMREFGQGTRSMIVTSTGWDVNTRALGVVPAEAKVTFLEGFHWILDAHYCCVPKGVPNDKLAVVLDLVKHLLQPPQQAMTYDAGYFYPGPAVAGVSVDQAPAESQRIIREFGRPEYDQLFGQRPLETPLDPAALVIAFRRWDEEVAGPKRQQ